MLQAVIHIFFFNIVPLFILILTGVFLGRSFSLDINTLTKINFYVTVPAYTFTHLYTTGLGNSQLLVLGFAVLQLLLLALIGYVTSSLLGHPKGMGKAFQNSVMFYNSGNIGIPLITLVFSTGVHALGDATPYLELALTTQVVILVVQNALTNTVGYFIASTTRGSSSQALRQIFRMPAVYVVPLAILMKLIPIDLTRMFFWPTLQISSNALVFIALVTLGVQLTRVEFRLDNRDIWAAAFLRLIGGPLMALALIRLFGISGIVARTLFISSAVPTAVNTALIAVENDNEPGFASQAVLLSTVLCSATLIVVIWLSSVVFPV